MAQQVRAVVARSMGAPATVETIVVPDPGPGEVLVAVDACGVCRTDLQYREGMITPDFPILLGHEASGRIEAVGSDVPDLAPGDFVVLNWRAVCGTCRSCRRGRPHLCFATRNAEQKMTLDGQPLTAALGIGGFAEKTLVAAGQATKVDPAIRPETAGLLGCGVTAGFGAAVHTAGVGPGDRVAVFGTGTVGTAAVMGARLAGAERIIAVGRRREPLERARRFGATDTVLAGDGHVVEAVRALTDGFGADVCIEAVGHPDVFDRAFRSRDLAGIVVQVGVPTPEMRLDLSMADFFGHGGALKPSWYGDSLPMRDLPLLVDLHLRGRLDLDGFVSETIELDEIEAAFTAMRRGGALRSVVIPGSRNDPGPGRRSSGR